MTDLLLPATDAGVLVQLAVLIVVGGVGIVASWNHGEVRTLVIGLVVAAAAWMALRTVH